MAQKAPPLPPVETPSYDELLLAMSPDSTRPSLARSESGEFYGPNFGVRGGVGFTQHTRSMSPKREK